MSEKLKKLATKGLQSCCTGDVLTDAVLTDLFDPFKPGESPASKAAKSTGGIARRSRLAAILKANEKTERKRITAANYVSYNSTYNY